MPENAASPKNRLNTLSVTLKPNPLYQELIKQSADEDKLEEMTLASFQISEAQIFKSYNTHATEITIWFEYLDPTVAAFLSEGKYIVHFEVNASVPGGSERFSGRSAANYFICTDLEITGEKVFGTLNTVNGIMELRSILHVRLKSENNFPVLLGGKGQQNTQTFTGSPADFLETELTPLFKKTYSRAGTQNSPWSQEFCSFENKGDSLVQAVSNCNYSFDSDTNWDTLNEFFQKYPVFNTPHGWMLDDFQNSDASSSVLRMTDFMWYEAWKPFKNIHLSEILNNEVPEEGTKKTSQDYRTASAIRYYGIRVLERVPYFDWTRFIIKNFNPLILAFNSCDESVLDTTDWNSTRKNAKVIMPDASVVGIENPMYKIYRTAITVKEIYQSQLFLKLFESMHPELVTYHFENIWFGEVDVNTVVFFDKDKLNKIRNHGYNRWGLGYQVLHTFNREAIKPKMAIGATESSNKDQVLSQYAYRFSLRSDVVFLELDERTLSIEGLDKVDKIVAEEKTEETGVETTDPCENKTDGVDDTTTEGDATPLDPEIPAGSNDVVEKIIAGIENSAKAAGYKYTDGGGRNNISNGADCSGLMYHGIQISAKYKFSRGDNVSQLNFVRKAKGWKMIFDSDKNPFSAEEITSSTPAKKFKRGDILWFKKSDKKTTTHVGIYLGDDQMLHASHSPKDKSKPGIIKSAVSGYLQRGYFRAAYRPTSDIE